MRKKADLKTSSKKYQKILSVDRNRRNIYTREHVRFIDEIFVSARL